MWIKCISLYQNFKRDELILRNVFLMEINCAQTNNREQFL